MVNRYAILETEELEQGGTRTFAANIAKAEPEYASEQGWIEAPDHISAGWTYDNGNWSEPEGKPPTDRGVNEERERRLVVGASFTVAGVNDPIALQGRPFDQTVYLALLTRASGYKAAGITDPVLRIRAADDVIHMLTPDQMISLISQAMTWFENVMATSWAMKDGTGDFTGGIPSDYTADAHWL